MLQQINVKKKSREIFYLKQVMVVIELSLSNFIFLIGIYFLKISFTVHIYPSDIRPRLCKY